MLAGTGLKIQAVSAVGQPHSRGGRCPCVPTRVESPEPDLTSMQ